MFLILSANSSIVIVCFILWIILYIISKWLNADLESSRRKWQGRIKKDGKHIKVPFDGLTIKSKKIYEYRREAYRRTRKSGYTENYSEAEPGTEQDLCWLEYSMVLEGESEIFESTPVVRDKKSLEIKLYMQQGVDLYYNESTGAYYFDMEPVEE